MLPSLSQAPSYPTDKESSGAEQSRQSSLCCILQMFLPWTCILRPTEERKDALSQPENPSPLNCTHLIQTELHWLLLGLLFIPGFTATCTGAECSVLGSLGRTNNSGPCAGASPSEVTGSNSLWSRPKGFSRAGRAALRAPTPSRRPGLTAAVLRPLPSRSQSPPPNEFSGKQIKRRAYITQQTAQAWISGCAAPLAAAAGTRSSPSEQQQ